MTENQLLELSDNVYKIKGKDTNNSVLLEISAKETFVINETQMTPEKTVDNEVIEEQMVNGIKHPTTAIMSNHIQPLPHEIDQSFDWKK